MAAPKHRSRFLSTPSARRATLGGVCFFLCAVISIHALCEEGDSTPARRRSWLIYFYPRPLRGGRRIPQRLIHNDRRFLSTPSARRATPKWLHLAAHAKISIHALCEEGDSTPTSAPSRSAYFYPRPLRGGRLSGLTGRLVQSRFLSTPSARRATQGCWRSAVE